MLTVLYRYKCITWFIYSCVSSTIFECNIPCVCVCVCVRVFVCLCLYPFLIQTISFSSGFTSNEWLRQKKQFHYYCANSMGWVCNVCACACGAEMRYTIEPNSITWTNSIQFIYGMVNQQKKHTGGVGVAERCKN